MIRVTRVGLLLVSFCHEIHGIFWTINPRSKKLSSGAPLSIQLSTVCPLAWQVAGVYISMEIVFLIGRRNCKFFMIIPKKCSYEVQMTLDHCHQGYRFQINGRHYWLLKFNVYAFIWQFLLLLISRQLHRQEPLQNVAIFWCLPLLKWKIMTIITNKIT